MRVFPNGTGILLGLFLCFSFAWFFPGGADWAETSFPVSISGSLVVVIFVSHGWNIRPNRIFPVFRDFPNLLLVQGGIFLSPLVFILALQSINFIPGEWHNGFIFLAILPTTISTCVVYTSIANGNADTALGYATLSNLFAIFWVPFAWSFFGVESGISVLESLVSFSRAILPQMIGFIIFPCFVGWLGKKVFLKVGDNDYESHFKRISFLSILLLAYLALAKSISMWGDSEFLNLLFQLIPYLLVFLIFHLFASWFIAKLLSSDRELKVAKFYCLSQKSLAMGLPIATLLPLDNLKLQILLVCPLIFYHFLQLFTGACLIPVLRKWVA